MGTITVDGAPLDLHLPAAATIASAFEVVRDDVLARGRIVTDVRVGGEPVTWQDGSPGWDHLYREEIELFVVTDFPIRISGPLLDRLVGALPEIAERHRGVAEAFRAQQADAAEEAAKLLGVWQDIENALDQVVVLHGVDLGKAPWADIAGELRQRFQRLSGCLTELRESLELKDMVLAADLMEFELAPLAEDFAGPSQTLEKALHKHFPAEAK